jgi:outer membrane receptor protein involved in Fe transport
MKRRIVLSLTAIFLALLFSTTLAAQTSSSLKGLVADEHGAKIANARVILRSRSGLELSTTTDQSGVYQFSELRPGPYLLEVRSEGFSTYSTGEIQLDRGEVKEFPVELKVAAIKASVVVTATGTFQREEEAAKVISTIDSDDVEARHELSLAESLRETPGVRIQQQGSPGALTTVRLRGQRNFDTAVLLDGLRVRDAGDINGSATSLITDLAPVDLDRIEILRGSGSSIYGTHAIGGVVNMIPEGGEEGLHFGAGFEGGSLASYRERLQVSGGGKKFGYHLGANRLDVRRGIDGHDQYGDSVFVGRLQVNPTPTITIGGNFYSTIANARVNDSPFALPAAFTAPGPFPQAIAGVTFQPDFNNPDQGRRNRLIVGSGRFSQAVNEKVSYTVAYQHVSSNRRNYNGPEVDPDFAAFVPFGDFEFFTVNRGNIDTLDSRVNLRFSQSNLATAGFEFEHESLFQQSEPSFSAFNNTTDRQKTFAVFGQDQLSFLNDALRFSIGVRAQSYRLNAADRPGQLQGSNAESSITGDGAVAYLIRSSNTKLRAHVGNGFRAASLFERFGNGTFPGLGLVRFGDPTLRAEQSISVDGGFDQRLATDRVLFGATYFYTRLQRVIAFASFSSDPLGLGRFSGFANRPGGLSRGVESFLNVSPLRGMEVRAAYTYTNSDRSVPLRGLVPEYVIPKHLFGLTFIQRYRSLLFSFDLNRTGSYLAPVFENDFPFRTAELTFSGYTKADLFASYERGVSEKVRLVLYGGLDNLFHQTIYENGFLAPRTVARGGINLKF